SPTSPTQPPSLGLRKPFRSPLLKRPPLAGHDACPRPARVLGTSLKRVFPIAKNAADVGTPPKRVKESTEVRSSLPPSTMPWQSRKVFAAFKSPLRVPLSASSDTASSQSDSNQDSPGGAAMGAIPSKHLGVRRKALIRRGPRHDPKAEGAIVLYTPPTPEELMLRKQKEQQDASKKSKSLESILNKARDGESEEVAVVLDPVIGRKLRPHQVDGVKFMFDCVTGRKVENAYGCIMADEMGLGKTLQCIALLWTLLK
ncbi:DNA repair and recombination protein RAD54-like, partial [Spiromyces aspiralis]